MPAIELPLLPSLLAACLVLVVGGFLAQRVPLLGRYSIPAPIIGGLLFAVLSLLARRLSGLAENALGLAIAQILGLHPVLGLVAGSITLVGGHGTGAAYAERFAEEHDILGVMSLTMTSATIGLVIGGIIGGPVAEGLIRRIPRGAAPSTVGDGGGGPVTTPITAPSFVLSLAAALVAVIAGQALASALKGVATVPEFLWCLLVGLVIRNGGAAVADDETNQQAPQEFWYSGHTFQGARQSLAGDDGDQCGSKREDERRRGDRGCHRPATAVAHRRRCSTARNTANQPFCDRAADDAADDETDRRRGHRQTHYAEDVVLFGKALRIGGTSPVPANQGD